MIYQVLVLLIFVLSRIHRNKRNNVRQNMQRPNNKPDRFVLMRVFLRSNRKDFPSLQEKRAVLFQDKAFRQEKLLPIDCTARGVMTRSF